MEDYEVIRTVEFRDVFTFASMNISIDSRSVKVPAETLFYALRGHNHDGHDYIRELYYRGVRRFVVCEDRPEFRQFPQAEFRRVEDTLSALQYDAAQHRMNMGAEVVGITGSNGKTIVKEWIAQATERDMNVVRSPRSYNSQVGVPLSLFEIREETQIALIEAGMSRKGEMERVERMVRPQVGIFTHFGDAHGENFSSEDEKLREKALLFKGVHLLICQEGSVACKLRTFLPSGVRFLTWGESDGDIRVNTLEHNSSSRTIELSGALTGRVVLPFGDTASLENGMSVIAYLHYKGYCMDEIAAKVAGLQPVAMRMEIKEGRGGSILIKDYYNSDLASFSIAVDSLSAQDPSRKRALILSDFAGTRDTRLYHSISRLVEEGRIELFVGIGEELTRNRELFSSVPQKRFYLTTDEFLKSERRESFDGYAVLIKGARIFKFEYIGAFLQKQSHTTVLEVDLDAMASNLNIYRAQLPYATKIAVMVKAFSYGSGSSEVAAMLQYQGVDYLMVAYADEGVELRSKGITLPIGVMNPEPEAFDQMIEFALEPEIYSLDLLEGFEASLDKAGVRNYPVHIKLNTGMNRSGLDMKDLPGLLEFFKMPRAAIVSSIFSHLAVADDPSDDEFTLRQVSLFEKMAAMIQEKFDYKITRHILNSAGIERFPQFHFEMVRLGIGLHGIGGLKGLRPVSSLKTHIASVRELMPGETVGYGRHGEILHPSKIAVIPVGYADGINRHLGCGVGKMWVNGVKVPIIGNICMDAIMLDVTEASAEVGDEVEIFGDHVKVTEISELLSTIPYEVLTGISRRVKRIYYKES